MKIAYFISPHGYGHATRSIAIMQALSRKAQHIKFSIVTSLNEQVFQDNGINYQYFPIVTDVGLYQHDAFNEDIEKTVNALDNLFPFNQDVLSEATAICRHCSYILCDISPLGIAVAEQLNIPSILLENFTWDWIYEPYLAESKELKTYAEQFKAYYARADYHLQLEPVCLSNSSADQSISPVFRLHRHEPGELFQDLPINNRPIILITLGGISTAYQFLQRLAAYPDYFFIIPSAGRYELTENALLLPVQSNYYHPDLIHNSDLVVCKTGYSTMAEIYHSGVPLAYLGRDKFPESEIIEAFIREYLSGKKLTQAEFASGDWLERLPELLQQPRKPVIDTNGADQIAEFILSIQTGV